MKKILLFCLSLLLSGVASLDGNAVTLPATANSSSGIRNYPNYTVTLDDGSVLGFYYGYSEVAFCGAITSATALEVPDALLINNKEYNVKYCGYQYGDASGVDFDKAPNLTSLTLPASVSTISQVVPSTITDLHLKSATPPSLNYNSNNIPMSTTIWVPLSALDAYQIYIEDSSNYWYGKEVHYEGWEPQCYTITTKSGGLTNELLKVVDQWTEVYELIIKGSLNAEDMKVFSKITLLRKLDLSQTDIKEIDGCSNLTKLQEVLLPSTVTTIKESAFLGCKKLSSINLSNVISIEKGAFAACGSLKTLDLPNAKELGEYAFYASTDLGTSSYNYYRNGEGLQSVNIPLVEKINKACFSGHKSLSTINMPKVKNIAEYAFANCYSISELDLSNVTELGARAFYMHDDYDTPKLTKVVLSDEITEIDYCFSNCRQLTEMNIPAKLKKISMYNDGLQTIILPEGLTEINQISSSALQTLHIPSTVTRIGTIGSPYSYSDLSTPLKDIYCYAVVPINTTTFNTDKNSYAQNPAGITLHVPAFSVSAYRMDDNWYKFGKIEPIEGGISNITIAQDFTIREYTGLNDNPNLTLTSNNQSSSSSSSSKTYGHLTIDADAALKLGNFTHYQNLYYSSSGQWNGNEYVYTTTYPYATSLITKNEVTANDIVMYVMLNAKTWNFISFPFDVNVSDIQMPGDDVLWVVRKYSGADRAALSGNTWQNMTNGMVLKAGEGYILHCTDDYNSGMIEMRVHAVNNATKNNVFASTDVTTPLKEYASEYAHNRSWNLIGNPYPCFYDIQSLDFDAPITVWDGYNYTAYSVLDDDYILGPNQAFFVQRPANSPSIIFGAEGRTHSYSKSASSYYSPRRAAKAGENRSVLNFNLIGNGHSDRARLVLNESAKAGYEINCDASKFMSSEAGVPQIYVLDGGIRYAIDERPIAEGQFTLGTYFGEAGEYTISLNVKNFEKSVMLIDTKTDITTDLTIEDYTFVAPAGSDDSRFMIVVDGVVTKIDDIDAAAENGTIYNLQGQRVGENAHGIIVRNGKKIQK